MSDLAKSVLAVIHANGDPSRALVMIRALCEAEPPPPNPEPEAAPTRRRRRAAPEGR